ncbi:hypothetical protein PAXINDRAFT_171232 [Paxillus involutus ATCC 200175]|uniref:FAD-binding domain-containing protein n=1 Tax=Paxillus involutus ATCC 200175 TaxID=664439 RepID=A0A0C9TPD5_PAXIN|nr:hypothetical protein PAXINDRAFT_171232 [Paxillus involutus ATCC 200175]
MGVASSIGQRRNRVPTSKTSSSLPVLVVGAGPAGLICALALRKSGIPVRIIEQSLEHHVGTRGAGIMPRSLELLQALGVLPELQRLRGLEAPPMQFYRLPGGTEVSSTAPGLMEKMDPVPSKPFNSMWFISQAVLEEVLRKELNTYGCKVELGTSLLDFQQDRDGVTANLSISETNSQESFRASFLVGADGAKGVTRKLLKCSFLGETKDDNGILVGNVVIENLSTEVWHLWKPSPYLFSLRPYDREHKKFVITVTGLSDEVGQGADAEKFESLFRESIGRSDVTFGEFEWLSYFKPNMRVVDKMSEGRVFLAGDSAHVHSPHGGQGLNTGIQDSFNLSWKLALVHKGRSPISLLASYNEERLPVVAEMLKQVTGLYNKSDGDASAQTAARGKHLFMLGINYRWSSIVVDKCSATQTPVEILKDRAYLGWDDELKAGDRAPECPNLRLGERRTSLFHLLTPKKHTVLVFVGEDLNGGLTQRILSVLRSKFTKDTTDVFLVGSGTVSSSASFPSLLDENGLARTAYQAAQATNGRPLVVIIRPDGIIGAMGDSDEVLKGYSTLVFKSG